MTRPCMSGWGETTGAQQLPPRRGRVESLGGASELAVTDFNHSGCLDEECELSVPGMTCSRLSLLLTWMQRSERFCESAFDGIAFSTVSPVIRERRGAAIATFQLPLRASGCSSLRRACLGC